MKIRTYLLVFALAILLPMIAFSAIAVVAFDRQQRAVVERGGIETARALVNAVDRELAPSLTTLQTLATARSLERGDLRDVPGGRPSGAGPSAGLDHDQPVRSDRTAGDGSRDPGGHCPDRPGRVRELPDGAAHGAAGDRSDHRGPRGRRAFAVRVPVLREGAVVSVLTGVIEPARSPRSSQRSRSPPTGSGRSSTRRARWWRGRGASRSHRAVCLARVRPLLSTSQEGWAITHTLEGAAGLHGVQPIAGDRLGRGTRDSARHHRRTAASLALGRGRRRRGVPGGGGGAVLAGGPAHRAPGGRAVIRGRRVRPGADRAARRPGSGPQEIAAVARAFDEACRARSRPAPRPRRPTAPRTSSSPCSPTSCARPSTRCTAGRGS